MEKETQKKVWAENADCLMQLDNKLGLYIRESDCQSFTILVKAISGIIDQRQRQLVNSMNFQESED
ncbi:MAG: hypothetical protein JW927_01400 [Deltaproteobacteria bacterium]|nr:hypothetical protein [Deltaproteobacteria bacterium]